MVVFLIAIGILVGVIAGQAYQKYLDRPVYIPEGMPHDKEMHPHHFHDHDVKKVKK